MTDTPARLKAARGALSQAKAAAQLGIPLRTWENWERGIRAAPEYIIAMIEKLHTTITELIGGKAEPMNDIQIYNSEFGQVRTIGQKGESMHDIQIYNSEFGQVRTINQNGDPWFIAADVCAALDIGRTSDAVSRLDADERGAVSTDTLGGRQYMLTVNESGLYALVLGSRKPEAKAFKRWITHEVIPTIRKTGGYIANDDLFVKTYLPNADEATAAMFRSTLETMRNLNAKIEADKPKVLFASAVETSHTSILVGELAKLIRQNGKEIGQNRLFQWMRENGFMMRYKNIPTQYSMERKLMEIKERTITNPDGSVRTTQTTLITGKGQTYFVSRLLGESA